MKFLNKKDRIIHLPNAQIQILGRDVSIVATNPNCIKPTFKVIVASEETTTDADLFFKVKPAKLFLFDGETEERIRFTAKTGE